MYLEASTTLISNPHSGREFGFAPFLPVFSDLYFSYSSCWDLLPILPDSENKEQINNAILERGRKLVRSLQTQGTHK